MMIGLLLWVACAPEQVTAGPDTWSGKTGPPILSVGEALDFGDVYVSGGDATQVLLSILNTGESTLVISAVHVDDDAFALGQLYPPTIEPGESATQVISYSPPYNIDSDAILTIEANTDAGSHEVALSGSGLAPELTVAPESIDFGTVGLGCDYAQPFTITNTGREPLVVTAVDLDGPSDTITITPDADLPWTLDPGEGVGATVSYRTVVSSEQARVLSVESNAPSSTTVPVVITGTGEPAERITSTQTYWAVRPADIVFVLDKSCSMDDDIASLEAGLSTFLSVLDEGAVPYRIASVVSDSGSVEGNHPYIDPDNARDADSIFSEMNSGLSGSYAEQAFTLFESAVQTGTNRPGGWLRGDASLHLVAVSDEPEQSDQDTWDGYVSAFQALKPSPTLFMTHGIGGDYPKGCTSAQPYTGVYEASVATGGAFLSICGDMVDNLNSLGESIALASNDWILLSADPVPELVEITVDGVPWSGGWSPAGDGYIVLDGDITDGAVIEVSYVALGECPE